MTPTLGILDPDQLSGAAKLAYAWLVRLSESELSKVKASFFLSTQPVLGESIVDAVAKAITIRGLKKIPEGYAAGIAAISAVPESRRLQKQDVSDMAGLLQVEAAALAAVEEVEAGGHGFLESGRPKILFEGHTFWKQLAAVGIEPGPLHTKFPNIVYKVWDKTQYKGGEKEYKRLRTAVEIHESAALRSASWGLFQIMGFNYQAAGFGSVINMVAAHLRSEREHLAAAASFIKNHPGMHQALRELNWDAFAKGYNGSGYKKNKYHTRLKASYEKHRPEYA